MHDIAPRQFGPASLAGVGLPSDRHARTAARRAFVELKTTFLDALQDLPDAEWLRQQVRSAEDPADLWLLRAPVFDLLTGAVPEQRVRRRMLRRGLDSLFPDLDPASGFAALAP